VNEFKEGVYFKHVHGNISVHRKDSILLIVYRVREQSFCFNASMKNNDLPVNQNLL